MKRVLAIASLVGAWTVGCQLVSGVNDLEVVDEASGGTSGAGGTVGGSSGMGGTSGGGGTSGAGGTVGGSSGMGGTTSTSTGGSSTGGTGGIGGSTSTTDSGGAAGTGGECTDNPDWECHLVTNCGCASTETCAYNANTDRTECGPIGETEPYERCFVDADCTLGHGCVANMCKKYCITAEDCGWENANCLGVYDGEELIEGFGYCGEACNPVDPTDPAEGSIACGEDSLCYAYIDDNDALQTTCIAPSGTGEQGDPCAEEGEANILLCAPGHFCDSVELTCTRFCDPGDDSVCEEGTICYPFGAPAEDLGYCDEGCDTGEFECSTYPQCGCEAGDSCKIDDFDTGATACLAEGTVPAWGECSLQADCSPEGGSCVGDFCYPFCQGPGTDTCEIGDCFQAVNTATSEPIPGAFYCNAPCEPVLTDRAAATNVKPCPDLYQCVAVSTEPTDLDTGAYCVPSEGGAVGSACERNDQCDDGLGCMESQCTPYCRNSADCPDEYPACTNLSVPLYASEGDQVRLCYLNN